MLFVPQRILHSDEEEAKRKEKKKMKAKKGWLAVKVGLEDDRLERFAIPMYYLHNPLFKPLMERAKETYGYSTSGPLRLPCSVDEFISLRSRIEGQTSWSLGLAYDQHSRYLKPV
ncbi:hypothetical protein Sjap_018310 [Stephania japonica]|uniref:Small auxin up regulated protein n=1 Tax=Stephania japonica TaxID=461633 RepID=A0AAP0I7W3_9MAGN